jgi:hypothetical protein
MNGKHIATRRGYGSKNYLIFSVVIIGAVSALAGAPHTVSLLVDFNAGTRRQGAIQKNFHKR